MKNTCAIYVRVSTTEQAEEGYSIQSQKERLINYCKAKEWDISDFYIDPGFSGSNLDRPAIQKLIKEIKNFDVVLVYKIDRLSRSQKDTLYLIEDVFLKNNIDFVSLSESFDTTSPYGRAFIGILSAFAQLERETIKERTILGKLERAKDGLFHGSLIPIGYDYKGGKLIINQYEALQIKEVYNLYLQGFGTRKISELMDARGCKHKYGGWNNNVTVTHALDNPIHTGKISHKGEIFDGDHEPIIPWETFQKVQEMRKSRKDMKTKVFMHNSLLSGFLFCAHCGGRYCLRHASNKRGGIYKYYACYSRNKTTKHMIKDPDCKNKTWRQETLDKIVVDQIMKIFLDPEYIKNIKNQNKKPEKTVELKPLKKKVENIEKQINKLLDLYQADNIAIKEISGRINSLYNEKKLLLESIEGIEEKEETEDTEELLAFISNILPVWEMGNLQEKRLIIEYLIKKIVIDNEKVTIIWRFL